MPVANCFINNKMLEEMDLENMVRDWATFAQVDSKHITINIITPSTQLGNPYPVIVNLYLPTLWSKTDIERIQLGLLKALLQNLKITESEVFIMTSLIEPGLVVENGQIIKW